ncbi:MAG: hypothetical protein NWF13_10025 [Candidatus Bathyarchaeota archaeon]|nr:hypothetical protein [Candidatus Bathyarchaeota archaeon]
MVDSTEIVVYGKRKIGMVKPLIYGQNLEPATCPKVYRMERREIRRDVVELATKRIRVPIIRWPGGNFASQYHWLDGVGPQEERPVMLSLARVGRLESNQMGTHEFLELCRELGAEPYITVNAGSGTAEEAAHWVEYCNIETPRIDRGRRFSEEYYRHLEEYYKRIGRSRYVKLRHTHGHPEPFGVKYWSIGNETWGDFQVETLTAEENARRAFEYAKLMKRVDPTIKVTAVGMFLSPYWKYAEHQDYTTSLEWNTEVLKAAGSVLRASAKLIDYISVHRYYWRHSGRGREGFPKEEYLALMACPIHSERELHALNGTIDLVMGLIEKDDRIQISYDEWSFGNRTLAQGLATARFFNVLQRMSSTVTIGCSEQWIAAVLAKGILVEPGHLAFDLYENHTGAIAVDTVVHTDTYDTAIQQYPETNIAPASFKRVPYVDSVATLSADGTRLHLATVNAYEKTGEECRIRLVGISVKKGGRIYELNGPDIMATNDPENPHNVKIVEKTIDNAGDTFTYEFPPHSATIIELLIA